MALSDYGRCMGLKAVKSNSWDISPCSDTFAVGCIV